MCGQGLGGGEPSDDVETWRARTTARPPPAAAKWVRRRAGGQPGEERAATCRASASPRNWWAARQALSGQAQRQRGVEFCSGRDRSEVPRPGRRHRRGHHRDRVLPAGQQAAGSSTPSWRPTPAWWRTRPSWKDKFKQSKIENLVTLLQGALLAKSMVGLMMNVPRRT